MNRRISNALSRKLVSFRNSKHSIFIHISLHSPKRIPSKSAFKVFFVLRRVNVFSSFRYTSAGCIPHIRYLLRPRFTQTNRLSAHPESSKKKTKQKSCQRETLDCHVRFCGLDVHSLFCSICNLLCTISTWRRRLLALPRLNKWSRKSKSEKNVEQLVALSSVSSFYALRHTLLASTVCAIVHRCVCTPRSTIHQSVHVHWVNSCRVHKECMCSLLCLVKSASENIRK